MNIRELTYVALKITGILGLLWAFRVWESAATLIILIDSQDHYIEIYDPSLGLFIISLIPFICTIFIAILLLARTELVIKWLSLPDYSEGANEIRIESFMGAAFAMLGITLLIIGISKLIYIPGQIMALGLYLFLGGGGLVKRWERYQDKTKLIDY